MNYSIFGNPKAESCVCTSIFLSIAASPRHDLSCKLISSVLQMLHVGPDIMLLLLAVMFHVEMIHH